MFSFDSLFDYIMFPFHFTALFVIIVFFRGADILGMSFPIITFRFGFFYFIVFRFDSLFYYITFPFHFTALFAVRFWLRWLAQPRLQVLDDVHEARLDAVREVVPLCAVVAPSPAEPLPAGGAPVRPLPRVLQQVAPQPTSVPEPPAAHPAAVRHLPRVLHQVLLQTGAAAKAVATQAARVAALARVRRNVPQQVGVASKTALALEAGEGLLAGVGDQVLAEAAGMGEGGAALAAGWEGFVVAAHVVEEAALLDVVAAALLAGEDLALLGVGGACVVDVFNLILMDVRP